MIKTTIIIVGMGPAGLTLGCLLGQAGIPTLLLDHQYQSPQKPRDDNRTAALLRPAVDILHSVGINPEHLDNTAPLRHLRLIDQPTTHQKQPVSIDFSAAEINEPYFALNIKNSPLHQALLKRIAHLPNVKTMAPVTIHTMTTRKGAITLETDRGTIAGALVVAADGKNSRIRTLSGIGVRHHDYGQSAMTFTIAHTKNHGDTSIEFHRPGGPLTLVPLARKNTSVVWMDKAPLIQDILSLSPQKFLARLTHEIGDVLGDINITSPVQSWPITWSMADHLTGPRHVLVAEAAHALPPSGAQGLNLSLRDVKCLADLVIQAHQTGIDPGSTPLLKRYEQQRRYDMTTRAYAVDGLNRIIMTAHPALRHLRRAGLIQLSRIRPLRHALMRFGWAA